MLEPEIARAQRLHSPLEADVSLLVVHQTKWWFGTTSLWPFVRPARPDYRRPQNHSVREESQCMLLPLLVAAGVLLASVLLYALSTTILVHFVVHLMQSGYSGLS